MGMDALPRAQGGDDGSGHARDWEAWLAQVADRRPLIDLDQLMRYAGHAAVFATGAAAPERDGLHPVGRLRIGGFVAENISPN